MKHAQIYRAGRIDGPIDALVIGSGMSGMSTAALLAKAGKRVIVLEQHTIAGGMTHTFTRKGFRWDVGVHYLGQVADPGSQLRRLFDDLSEGRLQWAALDDVYDRFVFPDQTFAIPRGEEAFRAMLLEHFPSEGRGINRYFKLIRQLRWKAELFFAQRALPPLPAACLRPLMVPPFHHWAKRTTLAVLREFIHDPKLIGVLTGYYGNYAAPPGQSSFGMHALVADYFRDGAAYPVGGGAAMFQAIAPTIEKAGGSVWVAAQVDRILLEKNRAVGVQMASGERLHAPIVVSSAGAWRTFHDLLPDSEPAQRLRGYVAATPPSIGHAGLYLGLDGDAESLALPAANYWLLAGYDHDALQARYLADPKQPFPAVFLSSGSAKDPAWPAQHPHRSVMEAVIQVPYDRVAQWQNTRWRKRGQDYETFKQELATRLSAQITTLLPQLKGKVAYQEMSTPLSTVHFAGNHRGAIYGLDHLPQRFAQKWLRPRLPIKGLFLTGQDTVTVGVGAATFSGLITASIILNRPVLLEVLWRTRRRNAG